mgnify:CR=1 FL=1
MTQDTTSLQAIEALIAKLLSEMEDVFLVSVRVKPVNNIKVFLDADGGLNIDRCVKINRAMYRTIEEEAWYPDGNFSLEVSSPGIDEPLKLLRQYKKNIGRTVEVMMNDGTKKEGKLTTVNNDEIIIEEKAGQSKKAPDSYRGKTTNILFNQVKHTKVLVTF